MYSDDLAEIDTLRIQLTATKIEHHQEEVWEDGLGGDDIRGGVSPESQYGWGPIVTGYRDIELVVPDLDARQAAIDRLKIIASTHPDGGVRQLAQTVIKPVLRDKRPWYWLWPFRK